MQIKTTLIHRAVSMARFPTWGVALIALMGSMTIPMRADQLRFAPPTLIDPTTLTVSSSGTYRETFYLDDDEDAILVFPSTTIYHPVIVKGGRNVVVIGGSIEHSGCYSRALSFTRMPAGSTVYIEGMSIDVSGAPGADGINANGESEDSPNVYIQNTVITGVHGLQAEHHGDAFQFDGSTSGNCLAGRGELYVGNCDIDTSYQGLIVSKHSYHDLAYTFINRVENTYFTYNNDSAYDGRCAYLYWTTSGVNLDKCNYLDLNNVWMNEWTAESLTIEDDHLFPGSSYNVDNTTFVVSTHEYVTGSVDKGIPTGGSMIIGSSTPGAGYSNTTGYKEVIGDYSYQSEATEHSDSGETSQIVSDVGAKEEAYVRFDADSAGDWIKFRIKPVPGGVREVTVRYLAGPDGGITEMAFGPSFSTTIDMYAATPTWKTHTHTTSLSYSIGTKYPYFTVTGKNASSSDYKLRIDEIKFADN